MKAGANRKHDTIIERWIDKEKATIRKQIKWEKKEGKTKQKNKNKKN